MILSVTCLLLYLLMNRFWPAGPLHPKMNLFANYYGAWGNSMSSCLFGMISRPLEVIACLTDPNKWFYLFYVAFPFLPFIFLRPRFLILTAPSVAIIFLMSGRDADIFHPVQLPYFAEACLFSFLAFLDFIGIARSMKTPTRQLGAMNHVMMLIVLLICCAMILFGLFGFCLVGGLSNHLVEHLKLRGRDLFLFLFLGMASVGLLFPLHLGGFFARHAGRSLMIGSLVLIAVFRLTTFGKNVLSVETDLLSGHLKVPRQCQDRNAAARNILSSVPADRWLTVPARYCMTASSRSKVILYNGNFPITSLNIYSESEPGYVFLDLQSLEDRQRRGMPLKLIDSEFSEHKSHAVNLLEDHKNWDVIFKDDSLFLLKRRRN